MASAAEQFSVKVSFVVFGMATELNARPLIMLAGLVISQLGTNLLRVSIDVRSTGGRYGVATR
jgi:hypothetical protein